MCNFKNQVGLMRQNRNQSFTLFVEWDQLEFQVSRLIKGISAFNNSANHCLTFNIVNI